MFWENPWGESGGSRKRAEKTVRAKKETKCKNLPLIGTAMEERPTYADTSERAQKDITKGVRILLPVSFLCAGRLLGEGVCGEGVRGWLASYLIV